MLASYVFLYVPSFSHQRQINQLISAITGAAAGHHHLPAAVDLADDPRDFDYDCRLVQSAVVWPHTVAS
jgi:hypothetical protein